MKSVQEASGRRHNPDALMDMSCDSGVGVDYRKKIRRLALRLLNPIIDLLLDCFTAFLVEPDETPGVEVSNFAELAEALVFEGKPREDQPNRPPATRKCQPAICEPGDMTGPVLAGTSPAAEWMSPPL